MIEYIDTNSYDYKVADISLAAEGRSQMASAKADMPNVESLLKKYSSSKPLDGIRVAASLPIDSKGAVLVEALVELGAKVRCCADATTSTSNEVAAALAADGVPVFAWKGESFGEFWWCLSRTLDFGEEEYANYIIDAAGKLGMIISTGKQAEVNPSMLEQDYSDRGDEFFELIETLFMLHRNWHQTAKMIVGVPADGEVAEVLGNIEKEGLKLQIL